MSDRESECSAPLAKLRRLEGPERDSSLTVAAGERGDPSSGEEMGRRKGKREEVAIETEQQTNAVSMGTESCVPEGAAEDEGGSPGRTCKEREEDPEALAAKTLAEMTGYFLDRNRVTKPAGSTEAEKEGSPPSKASNKESHENGVSEGMEKSLTQRDAADTEECSIISVETLPNLKMKRSVESLEAVQVELEVLNNRAEQAMMRMEKKFSHLRKPHLEKRNKIIQNIPGFWVTAFLNHPQLSALITERDEDALSYMTNLEVEDFKDNKFGYRIKFYFSENPYFQSEVIIKEFSRGTNGRMVSQSTRIRWWQGLNRSLVGSMASGSGCSFFSWFLDHSSPAVDRIAQIIKDDLWPNPLQYYLITENEGGENGQDESEPENGDDCVVIIDDDNDSENDDASDEDDDDDDDEIHEITDEEEDRELEEEGDGDDNDNEEEDDVIEEFNRADLEDEPGEARVQDKKEMAEENKSAEADIAGDKDGSDDG
ncbi:protein SET isoform X2 [Latimeria chalumnae]|uniref:protein SET isoform X2 n=1 Tax=Latimeria chalumnae TaxID=7897 RepID=UPI0003C17CC4|nr:PREDICTED: protein SET-like isoform X2 [Latimeria chalumnae]|eukprot:XP_006001495.1 PREDICTED: protein SET-like isoform X2 [Latimeria chalumnae]